MLRSGVPEKGVNLAGRRMGGESGLSALFHRSCSTHVSLCFWRRVSTASVTDELVKKIFHPRCQTKRKRYAFGLPRLFYATKSQGPSDL